MRPSVILSSLEQDCVYILSISQGDMCTPCAVHFTGTHRPGTITHPGILSRTTQTLKKKFYEQLTTAKPPSPHLASVDRWRGFYIPSLTSTTLASTSCICKNGNVAGGFVYNTFVCGRSV